jgi:hypothetical protein
MELPFSKSDAVFNEGPLQDLLTFNDGSPVVSSEDWRRRRKEIYDTIIPLEYGGMPPALEPEKTTIDIVSTSSPRAKSLFGVPKTLKYNIEVSIAGGLEPFRFNMKLWLPKSETPVPVIVTGDDCWEFITEEVGNDVVSRGFALVAFDRCFFARDRKDARDRGIYRAFPGEYGAVSAWAWGYHRVYDALLRIPEIDVTRMMITGHSRGGKAAQLAAATDERIALVADNNSGCGGFGLHRLRGFHSEAISNITSIFPFWFGKDFASYSHRESELPFDQHFLSALVAPRGLRFQIAFADTWANGVGACENYRETMKVYKLLGAEENFSIAFREGPHNHTPADWNHSLDFAQAFFERNGK